MALLWIEGFDAGGLLVDAHIRTYLSRKYSQASAAGGDFNDTGRFTGTSWRARADAYFVVPVANTDNVTIGFAFKTTAWAGVTNEACVVLADAGTEQLELVLVDGGDLRVRRGTTTLGTSVAAGLLINTWYYIEFQATIDNTVGAYEVKVDGSSILSGSGADTQVSANAYLNQVKFFGDDATVIYNFDDIYILDDTGADNNDYLGNMRVVMLKPTSDTADIDWTPQGAGDHYVEVDDGAVTDDDSTYVESSTSTDTDIYGYEDAASLADIAGVMIETEARETDATDYVLETVIKSGSTESNDAGQAVASTYTILSRLAELDPNTSALWTLSDLNSAQFGIEVQ